MLGYDTILSLDGVWKLYRAPQAVTAAWDALPVTENALCSRSLSPIPGTVPGNVELDLIQAGEMDDPLVEENISQAHRLEDHHFWYARTFIFSGETDGVYLQMEGVDTYATVYLNGQPVGQTDNMLIAHTLPLTALRQGENELVVHLAPTVLTARREEISLLTSALEYGYDGVRVGKAPHMFGWDIMPRVVSAGLWRSITLVRRQPVGFTQCYVYTRELMKDGAEMHLFYALELGNRLYDGLTLRLTLDDGENPHTEEWDVWAGAGNRRFRLPHPRLWWPRGYGEPFLYEATAELLDKNGEVLCAHRFTCGIRTVKLDRRPATAEDSGEFRFVVNDRPVYLLGTNWVPLDVYPSRHAARLKAAIDLTVDVGCNAIRCWGGNVYESDEFYRLCDEKGLLVWQDFSMACGAYPLDGDFRCRLEKEVRQVIRRLRQHPCLALWSGDNEGDYNYIFGLVDPNHNPLTRQLLPELVMQEDGVRSFLPSSPYLDESVSAGAPAVEDHLWGERLFFDVPYYTETTARFASEIGYHGSVSPASAREFLSPEHLAPVPDDPQWLIHASSPVAREKSSFGYRIRLMHTQVANMTGEHLTELDAFARYSQISQAEAMKLFVETFRCRMGENNGIIWWNIVDGCPQFSDAVVDYYYRKKLAYHFIRTSQSPVLLCVRREADGWFLYGINSTDSLHTLSATAEDAYTEQLLWEGTVELPPRESRQLVCLTTGGKAAFAVIRWTDETGESGLNHKYMGPYPLDIHQYIHTAEQLSLLPWEGFDDE